ncbi:hypothetical protein [Streptomyces swartbergensis]|uniref:hypothetical protein n=1 Tax=Streptomyces swartbergensis TaxID=487165 RepID=UPI0037F3B9DA
MGIGEQLHQQALLWRDQDPPARLEPVLRAVEERGGGARETAGPPYDHHGRQFMLVANEEYLLRIALHAHFDDIESRPVAEVLAPLEQLVFADLPVHLQEGGGEIALPAWRRRFEHLPHLCSRLAAVARVLDFTNGVHPSGKGKGKGKGGSAWPTTGGSTYGW